MTNSTQTTDPKTGPDPKAGARKRKLPTDFQEAMARLTGSKSINSPGVFVASSAVQVTFGAALRWLAGPLPAAALAVAAAGVLLCARRVGMGIRVDWETADRYLQDRFNALKEHNPRAASRIHGGMSGARGALGADAAYLYVMECRCGEQGASPHCKCETMRRTAGIVRLQYPVVAVGDLLLASDQLDFVLVHELHHMRAFWRRLRLLWLMLLTTGWLLITLLTPLPWTMSSVVALWTLLMGWSWAEEIACDRAALRSNPRMGVQYFRAILAAQSAAIKALPWWRRLTLLALPIHPPLRLRHYYATVAALRSNAELRGTNTTPGKAQ
jgi:hypothetical protein